MTITVWTKIGCGWCDEVTDLLRQRGLPFEERVVTGNRALMEELVRKSGQTLAPVVEIDGHLLVDTDAGEVERYLNAVARA
jgi:glutathione-dependent peroxiredoxin